MRRETFSSLKAVHSCHRLAHDYLYRHPTDTLTHPCPACGQLLTAASLNPDSTATCPNCHTPTPLPGHVAHAFRQHLAANVDVLNYRMSFPPESDRFLPPPPLGLVVKRLAVPLIVLLLIILFTLAIATARTLSSIPRTPPPLPAPVRP